MAVSGVRHSNHGNLLRRLSRVGHRRLIELSPQKSKTRIGRKDQSRVRSEGYESSH